MTTSNTAVDNATVKTDAEKAHEKLAEKRRALGRGLESLLPGPRVVALPPTLPQSARKDGAPALKDGTLAPDASSPDSSSAQVGEIQADAVSGEYAFEDRADQIEQNPRTRPRKSSIGKSPADFAARIQAQERDLRPDLVVRPSAVRPSAIGPGVSEPGGPERFTLILGERRYRASKLAGRTTIPAIVKRVSEQQAAEMTLVENLQRQDLGCLESRPRLLPS